MEFGKTIINQSKQIKHLIEEHWNTQFYGEIKGRSISFKNKNHRFIQVILTDSPLITKACVIKFYLCYIDNYNEQVKNLINDYNRSMYYSKIFLSNNKCVMRTDYPLDFKDISASRFKNFLNIVDSNAITCREEILKITKKATEYQSKIDIEGLKEFDIEEELKGIESNVF